MFLIVSSLMLYIYIYYIGHIASFSNDKLKVYNLTDDLTVLAVCKGLKIYIAGCHI